MLKHSGREQILKELARAAEDKWGQHADELRQDLETTAESLSKLETFQPQPDQEPPLLTPVLEALAQKAKNGAV